MFQYLTFKLYIYIYICIPVYKFKCKSFTIYIVAERTSVYIYICIYIFEIANTLTLHCGQVRLMRNALLGHSKTQMTSPHGWGYLLSFLMCLSATFVNMSVHLEFGNQELTNGSAKEKD